MEPRETPGPKCIFPRKTDSNVKSFNGIMKLGYRIHSKIFGLLEIKRATELTIYFALRYITVLGN